MVSSFSFLADVGFCFVIIGFWPGKSLLQNLGNSLATGISTGSVAGNYLERRQKHSELRSNDIVLIQEHTQSATGTFLEHNHNATRMQPKSIYKARLFKPKSQF